MLQLAVALLQLLPKIFLWLVLPIASFSLLLAPVRKSRRHAALGFMIAAAISATFLALETAAFGYICCDQARMLFSILLDFRPGVTLGFALALLGSVVRPILGVAPMLIAAVLTGGAAFLLSRGNVKNSQPGDVTATGHAETA